VNTVILNWQRPLWKGDWESMEEVGLKLINVGCNTQCMEAMLGISLNSYLYPKLAKAICLSYYLLGFLFNKTGEQEG
jgi:hypothetical protein